MTRVKIGAKPTEAEDRLTGTAAPPPAWCAAPSSSMYLDPRGNVQSCCQNVMFPLGRVGDQSIGEIWTGERRAALVSALDAGDFSKGCDRCAPDANTDSGRSSYARVFDSLASPDAAVASTSGPRQLELALSNRCNLQCVMCNGELSSAIRAQRDRLPPIPSAYGDDFFDQLAEWLPTVERLVLLGGEPFLARETTRVFDLIESTGSSPRVHVTTNGTVWNRTVERAIARGTLDISVSIDALDPHLFESIRVGASHAEVFANLERYRQSALDTDSTVSVSFTLMNNNADQLAPVLVFSAERGLTVHVNVCNDPPVFAIFRQSPQRIDEIQALLEGSEATDEQLGCNAATWNAVLTQVRSHSRQPVASALADGLRVLADANPTAALGNDAPHRAITVTTDDDLLIRSVDPPDATVGTLSLSSLVGSPIQALRDRLAALGGPTFAATVERLESGIEVQHLRFGAHATPPAITAVMIPRAPDDGGGMVVLLGEP